MTSEIERIKVHPQLQNSGQAPGLEIWRIENFEPIRQLDSTKFGQFYEGDSYVVLNTKSLKGHSSYSYSIHFWLGCSSTQDELGSAAIRAVELDEYLDGSATQYREVQGHESKVFASYFKQGIRYSKGGIKSGFNKVDDRYTKRLFQVKGKRNVRVCQVECKCGSLNQSDVFILDHKQAIFVWLGPTCSKMERIQGVNIARSIRDDERGGKVAIEIVENWDSNEEFFKALGSKDKIISKVGVDGGKDLDLLRMAERPTALYEIIFTEKNPDPEINEISVRPLQKLILKSENCYVLDSGTSGIFVWTGRNCPWELKKKVWKGLHAFIVEQGLPNWINVVRIVQNAETVVFKQYFSDWHDEPLKLVNETAGGNVAKQSDQEFDASLMYKRQTLDDFMPDDGSGTVEVWRIENFKRVSVPKEAYGFFFGGDSYVILYTYLKGGANQNIIYFWQGLKSTPDEKGTSALSAIEIDDNLGGAAIQIRVIMNKEPEHFLKIFGGKIVYFLGGHVSGFRNVHDRDDFDPNLVVMFHVRSNNASSTRAMQVPARASSLNSNDIFVIETPETVAVWVGKGCNKEEIEFVTLVCDYLTPERGSPLIYEEGSEPGIFWECLGGKESYYTGAPKLDLSKDAYQYESMTRLFHCSNSSGRFKVDEIVAFNQQDLIQDDVMILDTYDVIFIWIGSGSNEIEKREALKISYAYLNGDPTGRNEDNTVIVVVKQGYEPTQFTGHFFPWDNELWNQGLSFDEIVAKVGQENLGITTLKEEYLKYTSFYPLEVLQRRIPPEGVDVTAREMYLNDQDFLEVFGVTKSQYDNLPRWRQINLRKANSLF